MLYNLKMFLKYGKNRYRKYQRGYSNMATENIILKEVCPYGNPVARSHARRILRDKDEFKEIIFDFNGIEFMGQGFADEIFRVFQNAHPDIVLRPINANEAVLGMIQHVIRA